MSARMLVIEVNGSTRLVEDADYDKINEAVGGWIESVPVDGDITIYVNEEGKLKGLPVNMAADSLWVKVFPVEARMPGDMLVGPAAVFGGGDAEGNETDVPDWVLDMFGVAR